MTLGEAHLAAPSDRWPNSVSANIPHGSPHLCFLQHSPYRLCYDGVTHAYASTVKEREEAGWILSRSWIRSSPSCASGAA